jgi:hypothetical protein
MQLQKIGSARYGRRPGRGLDGEGEAISLSRLCVAVGDWIWMVADRLVPRERSVNPCSITLRNAFSVGHRSAPAA